MPFPCFPFFFMRDPCRRPVSSCLKRGEIGAIPEKALPVFTEITARDLAERHLNTEKLRSASFVAVTCPDGTGELLLAVNPSGEALSAEVSVGSRKPLFVIGSADIAEGKVTLGAQSFVVLK